MKKFGIFALCLLVTLALTSCDNPRRKAANEVSTIGQLRTIFSAQHQFRTLRHDGRNYGSFAQLRAKNLISDGKSIKKIDPLTFERTGYRFEMKVQKAKPEKKISSSFQVVATPLSSSTGNRSFYIDDSGAITFTKDGSKPGPNSKKLD